MTGESSQPSSGFASPSYTAMLTSFLMKVSSPMNCLIAPRPVVPYPVAFLYRGPNRATTIWSVKDGAVDVSDPMFTTASHVWACAGSLVSLGPPVNSAPSKRFRSLVRTGTMPISDNCRARVASSWSGFFRRSTLRTSVPASICVPWFSGIASGTEPLMMLRSGSLGGLTTLPESSRRVSSISNGTVNLAYVSNWMPVDCPSFWLDSLLVTSVGAIGTDGTTRMTGPGIAEYCTAVERVASRWSDVDADVSNLEEVV
ncbi:hypothetical protein [Lentzea flava]|uniref:hypothetical protein n=1 Tax=Lentzea flava TaxID=103732 RepID=UPI001670F755|nr:hypothetical protein [Lentzea flava]